MESKYSVYTSVSTALAVGGTRAAGGGNASGRVATAAFLRRIILYWRFESSSAAAFLVEAYSAMFDTENDIHPVLWSKQYCSENAMYRLQSVPAATELPRFHRPSID